MSQDVLSTVDHEELWRNTLATLNSLSSLKISRFRVSMVAGGEVFVGGFGDVRQAKLLTTIFGKNPVVALKLLRPAGSREQRIRVIASLARELNVWSKLMHPNILTLNGFYFDATSLTKAWIATPWQKKGNLLKYVETQELGVKARLKLVLDTILGLEYLHNLLPSVCHGDIKAENTLIDDDSNAQLCDFGLAKILEDVPSGLTTTSTSGCSFRYAAPELLRNDSLHTLQTDMWAWGCLVLVIMTGLLPYHSHNREASIIHAIRNDELPSDLSDIDTPAFIQSLLSRCWQQDPRARPTSSECRGELRTWSLFRSATKLPLSEIPLRYKMEGNGWVAILNPISQKAYELEFLSNPISLSWPPAFVFSSDGQHIAVVNSNGTDVLYEGVTGRKLRELDFSSHPTNSRIREDTRVCAISFCNSGSLLATGHQNGDVRIWDFPTQTLRLELKGHQSEITAVTFSHSDTILVSASWMEDSVRTWNVERGALLHEIRVRDVWDVVGSPHHPFVIAACSTWEEENSTILDAELGRTFDIPKNVMAAAFIGHGRAFITGGEEAGLTTWDLRPLLEHRERRVSGGVSPSDEKEPVLVGMPLEGPQDNIDTLSVSSDGQLAASGSSLNDDLVLWDLAARQPVLKMEGNLLYSILRVAFRPGSTSSQGTIAYTYQKQNSLERELHLIHYRLRP